MWVYFVVFLAFLFYYLWQLPMEWRNWRSPSLWAVNLVGFSSLILLITCFYRIPNGWFRTAVMYCETVYFVLLVFTLTLGIFRQVTYYPLRHWGGKRMQRLFADRRLFMWIIAVSTVLYCGAGIYQMEHLKVTPYTVTIDKPAGDSLRIALLSDLHMGTGASYAQLERMVAAVNNSQVDAVILAGDIADSSSSQEDLNALFDALSRMESRYGTYFTEGNHEKQCHYPVNPGLEAAGVQILHDSAVILPNGAALLGRCDDRKVPIPELRDKEGIGEDMPCIVVQHRPQGLKKLAGQADLILCGHTHGYQLPMCAFYFPLLFDPVEGWTEFGSTQAITTTGVSAWGFHCTWPSVSEIALIDVHFAGGDSHAA